MEFYVKLRRAAEAEACWERFGAMAMQCPGVARLCCLNPKTQAFLSFLMSFKAFEELSERLILLLENLKQGFQQMRLLDLKMGQETSVACWKGKSRLNAWKNSCVDQRTNSAGSFGRLNELNECS